ncbi:MAG: hypothetical protein IH624_15205 [Phycisphaerae bacterium]|nr:hypothetical protein [Phycisphaerae bacterium]
MSRIADVAEAVADVYTWIDAQIAASKATCRACGRCCDFERYDHRLFVTSVELMHFCETVPEPQLRRMPAGVCPYQVDGTCSVYTSRFAGCRIFSCSGQAETQSRLSEEASARFKQICERFNVPYAYLDLKTALNKAPSNR